MIYLINTFPIILLKLSPYLAVGLMFAAAAVILFRHLSPLAGGQGRCGITNKASSLQNTQNNQSCSGCSGCSVYACPGKKENLPANDDILVSETKEAGSVKS